MKISTLISKIRQLSGYKNFEALDSSDALSSNTVISAINEAQVYISSLQPRSFLQPYFLYSKNTIGTDLYVAASDTSKIPTSTKVAKDYVNLPVKFLENTPLYFYDERNNSKFNTPNLQYGYWNDNDFSNMLYYPSDLNKILGDAVKINYYILNSLQNISVTEQHLNTFHIEFHIYNDETNAILKIAKIQLYNNAVFSDTYIGEVSIFVDYNLKVVRFSHKGVSSARYRIEYFSYVSEPNIFLMHDNKIRNLAANNQNKDFVNLQVYMKPYSVIDEMQDLSNLITANQTLWDYYDNEFRRKFTG